MIFYYIYAQLFFFLMDICTQFICCENIMTRQKKAYCNYRFFVVVNFISITNTYF